MKVSDSWVDRYVTEDFGPVLNDLASDLKHARAALREIRGCAWVDKHGLERYNVLKIESILNSAIGPPSTPDTGTEP
jgi:hypothetical protein